MTLQTRPTEPPRDRTDPRVWVAAAVTVVLWASAFIAIRGAAPYFDPGSMALLRMVVGSLTLGLIVLRRGVIWPPRRAWPLVIGWGVAWFCLYNLSLNTAEEVLDAGTSAMIVNLAPLIVVALAGLLLAEGFPRALVVGAPISFLGVLIIGAQSWSGHAPWWGLALALLAAVLYAGCTLLQKRLLRTTDAATLTWLGATAGAIVLLPWLGKLLPELRAAPLEGTLAVVYMGIFPTAIAFSTWAFVLRRLSAGRTSATTYVVPALALLLSWLVLGETPTVVTLLGGALCLVGVFVAQVRSRRVATHTTLEPPTVAQECPTGREA